jgi:hypothetical protein
MIWDELAKASLFGADRYELQPPLRARLEKVGINRNETPARAILEGAAIYRNLQRAGFPLPQVKALAADFPSTNTTLKKHTAHSARYLWEILSGKRYKALGEYLQLLVAHHIQIPPEQLPFIYDISLKNKAIWRTVQPLIKEQEQWLLTQNDAWMTLVSLEDASSWDEAAAEEKRGIIRYLRQNAPDQAIPLLEKDWAKFNYQDKQQLLGLLAVNLNEHDEAFLKSCLKDSRKEVRLRAARLLLVLPGSQLQQQLFDAMKAGIHQQKKGIILPSGEKILKDFKGMGVDFSDKSMKAGQHKGGISSLVSWLAPQSWEAMLGGGVLDNIRKLSHAPGGDEWLSACGWAALRFNDHSWIEAMLRFWWRTDDVNAWSSTLGKRMMQALPSAVFDEMIAQHFQAYSGLIEESSFIGQLVSLGKHSWGQQASLLILKSFQAWVNTNESYYWNLWHYKQFLKVAAYKADTSIFDRIKNGWDERSLVWGQWERDVKHMLRVLEFRKQMKEALKQIK